MAKTIKFNLICDGNPIRTIEDLRENFVIEDVLSYFENRLLHRWLNVRGYDELLSKVEKVSSTDSVDIIKALINIFEVEVDLKAIEENTYILQFHKENQFLLNEYKKMDYKVSTIIDDYYSGYISIVDRIIENKEDMSQIKACISELEKSYMCLLEYDYRALFYKLLDQAPMAIFAILMRDKLRYFYLPKPKSAIGRMTEALTRAFETAFANAAGANKAAVQKKVQPDYEEMDEDKKEMFTKITSLLSNAAQLQEILGDNLKEFAGITDGYWKDVETKDKKYMILRMESGNYVRETGVSGGDLGSTAINNKFVILDGIDYKSNSQTQKLLYLEV